jgi:CO dehydrogenase/acetyl-CoA synthase complex epsilon subunit
MVRLFHEKKIPIFSTPLGGKYLREMGIAPVREFAIHDFTKRISDGRWDVLGMEVQTIVFAGIVYYLQSQGLSAIKHNALDVRTISLDPYCSPNATYSSPSIPKKQMDSFFAETVAALEGF